MKRRLLIIAICLLLGAVVNVAVAWGCAVRAPVQIFVIYHGPVERIDTPVWRTTRHKQRGALYLPRSPEPAVAALRGSLPYPPEGSPG